jgi:DNA-binding response OmpR family regulator
MSRVLIIEDEANIRKFAAINLGARGYEVIQAGTATEGLERLRDSSPDVLLLDIRLPDMTGWDVLRIMSEDETIPKIPVIVITASASGAPDPGIYENLRRIMIKPVSVQELTLVVKEALV